MNQTATLFEAAFPYGDDILGLPVTDIDQAATWYAEHFGLTEVERQTSPVPSVIMERDGVRIGFAINGLDPGNEGAAIRVACLDRTKEEWASRGVPIANERVDERDGKQYRVFFVVAPDGLCYYFHQLIE